MQQLKNLEMTQKEPLQKAPVASLDDFFKLGWYTLLVCLLSEFMILNQVGNMLYMMYAGKFNLKPRPQLESTFLKRPVFFASHCNC